MFADESFVTEPECSFVIGGESGATILPGFFDNDRKFWFAPFTDQNSVALVRGEFEGRHPNFVTDTGQGRFVTFRAAVCFSFQNFRSGIVEKPLSFDVVSAGRRGCYE